MSEEIREAVKEKYASVAQGGLSSNAAGVRAVAEAFGYTPEELASIPAEANMGVSCGNPTAFASLKPGEVVDSGADLNAYAKIENASSCCSPPSDSPLPIADAESCCSTQSPDSSDVHQRLADLLRKHNVNDYAVSVRVYAVKPM